MGIGAAGAAGGGGQIMGGVADFMESRRQADIVGTQGKLAKRASEGQQRKTVGTQVARTGASGVELSGSTLDLINQTNKEFELDQQIIKESSRLEQDAIKRQGTMDLIGGIAGGASTVSGSMKPKQKPTIKATKDPYQHAGQWGGVNPLLKKQTAPGVMLK